MLLLNVSTGISGVDVDEYSPRKWPSLLGDFSWTWMVQDGLRRSVHGVQWRASPGRL